MTAIESDPRVEKVFETYPIRVRDKMVFLRNLVHEVANKSEDIRNLEETLRWGEPSFITKHGSTLRMDWKEKNPNQYAIYFKCTSQLVPTFKLVYGDLFKYEKTRAILFDLDDEIPITEIKNCIKACLTYHKVKKLPFLGMG